MLNKLFGNPNSRTLRRFQPIVTDINLLADEISSLNDDDLRAKTSAFRQSLSNIGDPKKELEYLDL